ncbi:MAG: hypothetical protein HKP58_10105 [Desulfatitalea sp.]|nr:hypothetical protein [Desulfatitalea sp.]
MSPHRWLLDVHHNAFVGGCNTGGTYPVSLTGGVVRALRFTDNRFEDNSKENDLSITDQAVDLLRVSANDHDKGVNILASTIKDIYEADLTGEQFKRMDCVGNQQFRTQFNTPQKIKYIVTHNGHQFTVHFMQTHREADGPNVTLLNNESLVLAGGDFSPPDGTIMEFVRRDNITYEINRVGPPRCENRKSGT